jgi:ABC-type glycerol-3-phosphate transport system substrate-binding protein
MRRLLAVAVALALLGGAVGGAGAQAPIESELTLITPVSKFIHDAALKAFADYAKEKWNVTVRTNAIPAGTPVAYGRIVEWKGKPDADIFWGGESALFEKLAEQNLLQKLDLGQEAGTASRPRSASPSPSRSRTSGGTGWAPRWSPTDSSITR